MSAKPFAKAVNAVPLEKMTIPTCMVVFREERATEFLGARERLGKLRQEKDELMAQIPDTMVMEEAEKPRDTFVLVRGSYQNKGEKVNPGTPACWPPLPKDQPVNRLTPPKARSNSRPKSAARKQSRPASRRT